MIIVRRHIQQSLRGIFFCVSHEKPKGWTKAFGQDFCVECRVEVLKILVENSRKSGKSGLIQRAIDELSKEETPTND